MPSSFSMVISVSSSADFLILLSSMLGDVNIVVYSFVPCSRLNK